ncbi:hypothetical protein TrST_g2361 [Triparma strigata]|uniref:EF-hand domain-containing protein n=1 Tax=Triparma strigata TaxID=1606541 RepID=A0A9W6ZXP1_9STRA|nr:hypothetical protein TrST_g2361 [Triparma strigata]
MVCGGDEEEKVRTAFELYDKGGDGYITLEEFTEYLGSVFKVIYSLKKGLQEEVGATAEELAAATARSAFEEADINDDGVLSYPEFKRWYEASAVGNPEYMEAPSNTRRDDPETSLGQFRKMSKLASCDIRDVAEVYSSAGKGGWISYRGYVQGTARLWQYLGERGGERVRDSIWEGLRRYPITKLPGSYVRAVAASIGHRDKDNLNPYLIHEGEVAALSSLIAAMTVVCGGQRSAKVEEAFSMFDADGDGYISLHEMTEYLTTIVSIFAKSGVDVGDVASVAANMARQAFSKADSRNDGRISLAEFKEWYTSTSAEEIKGYANSEVVTLEMLKRTALSKVSVKTLFETFASVANPSSGIISKRNFHSCFEMMLGDRGPQVHRLVDDLYRIFERPDGGDGVSFDEVVVGLSVLVGGDQDTKIRSAFEIFDLNGDGYISFDEMKTYLTSVFKVLFEVNPEKRREHAIEGVSAETLGQVTAEQVFEEADLNSDGRLSYEEFHIWRSKQEAGEGDQDASNSSPDDKREHSGSFSDNSYDPLAYDVDSGGMHPITMEEVQKITGLEDLHVEDVFELFAGLANEEGYLTKEAFFRCFAQLIRARIHLLGEQERSRILFVVESLFQALDFNGDELIDFAELASGISVLCGGERDDKVMAAFSLFDLNGDGFISLDEMITYLTSMFCMLYQINPDIISQVNCGPEELAQQTAMQAFADADLNHDGRLSFKEFTTWYMQDGLGNAYGDKAGDDDDDDDDDDEEDYEDYDEYEDEEEEDDDDDEEEEEEEMYTPPQHRSVPKTLKEIRQLTTFKAHSPEVVFDVFAQYTDMRGMLSRQGFLQGLSKFIVTAEPPLATYLESFTSYLGNELFSAFLSNEFPSEELIDFSEICSGVSVLCGGTRDEKAKAAFSLFDVNGTSSISQFDLSVYLSSVFKLLFWMNPEIGPTNGGVTPDLLGSKTAEEAFLELKISENHELSFDQFKDWYEDPGASGEAEGEGASPSTSTPTTTTTTTMKTMTWKDIRDLTALKHYGISEVMEVFMGDVYPTGVVDVAAMYRFFVKLNRSAGGFNDGSGDASMHQKLKDFSFGFMDMFETQGMDGGRKVVNFNDVATVLTMLCTAKKEDKMRTAFTLYDEDDDGHLSRSQIESLMMSIFSVQKFMDPNKVINSVTEIAAISAKEAFDEARLNANGHISLEEFTKWYTTDSGGSGGSGESGGGVKRKAEDDGDERGEGEDQEKRYNLSVKDKLEATKILLGLGSVTVDDLLEILSESAPDGNLGKEAFLKCLQNIGALGGSPCYGSNFAMAMQVGARIFNSFDSASTGKVDFAELTSGLSVLCNSTAKEKIITTFTIHDSDGDGHLSLDETTHFVTSVMKVLYEAADLEASFGISPYELAVITTQQCFNEAELMNGLISIGELLNYFQPMFAGDV